MNDLNDIGQYSEQLTVSFEIVKAKNFKIAFGAQESGGRERGVGNDRSQVGRANRNIYREKQFLEGRFLKWT